MLNSGALPAREIVKKTALKRATVYHILDLLVARGLIAKNESGPKTVFFPLSPGNLEEVVAAKEAEVRRGKQGLTDLNDRLRSLYNLIQDKPTVRFYEGPEGIKKVLEDSLSAKGTIYTYADTEAVEQNVKDINDQYVKRRIEKMIPKKIISLDSPFAHEDYSKNSGPYTEARLIPGPANPFRTGMQIYNNTISYQTLDSKKMIGVIIEDERIARLHKTIFEFIWNSLKPLPGTPHAR
jgi:sugar-specific transcriptional regulator TrmB